MDKFFLIGDRHLFGRYTLPEKNTDRVTLSETHSIQGKLEELTLQINDASISILVQVLVFLVAIYWLLPIFSKKLKLIRNRSLTIQHFCQIPCKNCRFLAKNQYLWNWASNLRTLSPRRC